MVFVAKSFEMDIIAWSLNLTEERCNEVGVNFAKSKDELFKESDIVSIHLVLSESTKNLITYKELSMMKESAFLINLSSELKDI